MEEFSVRHAAENRPELNNALINRYVKTLRARSNVFVERQSKTVRGSERGAPDAKTFKGLRDRALLAALIGCGLRRAEAASLCFSHIQPREGRWVIVNTVGKRDKMQTVPMPSWAKSAIDD